MAWTDFPVAEGDDVQRYEWLIQFWKACRERARAASLSCGVWPLTADVWYSGTITGITNTTLTETGAGWPIDWSDYTPTGPDDFIPEEYDVVIEGDDNDVRTVIQRSIDATNMTTKTLTFSSIEDYVTAGAIADISDLVGKKYYIIRRFGVFWHDRWLQPPNDNELTQGQFTASDTGSITDNDREVEWTEDQWAGKDLIVHGDDGKLHRLTITENTEDTIGFATQTWTPDGPHFVVLEPGDYGWPGRKADAAYRWYILGTGGFSFDNPARQFWTHNPLDALVPGALPKVSQTVLSGEECDEEQIVYIYDADLKIAWDDECNTPRDTFFNPYGWRSLRWLQAFCENISLAFIEPRNYTGESQIPMYVPATWFKTFLTEDVNWFSRTITGYSGGHTFATLGADNIPPNIYYAVIDDDDAVLDWGMASGTNTSISAGDEDHVGKTIIISFGWTRWVPREFRYLWPKQCFIPDIDSDEETGEFFAVVPPTSEAPGFWENRAASTTFSTREELYFPSHSGTPGQLTDGGGAFVEENVARYLGDNYSDLTTDDPVTEASVSRPDGMDVTTPFRDKFFTGQGPLQNVGDDAGTVAAGATDHSLTGVGKNWWYEGTMITHTGSGTSGSTATSLTDSAKTGDGFFETTNRLLSLIVEVEVSSGVWEKRPITAHDAGTLTIEWDEPLSVTSLGKAYRIREPNANYGGINRWQGRTIEVTSSDGEDTDTSVITHSDDNTVWFDPPLSFTPDEDSSFTIREPLPGTVWLRRSGEWIKPPIEETDPRGVDEWPDDTTRILPTRVKRFGRMMIGDDVTPHLFNELRDGLNKLIWTRVGYAWTNDGESNYKQVGEQIHDPIAYSIGCGPYSYPSPPCSSFSTWAAASGAALGDNATAFAGATAGANVGSPLAVGVLYGSTSYHIDGITVIGAATAGRARRFGFGLMTGLPECMNSRCEFWVYGMIDVTDPDEGTVSTGTPTSQIDTYSFNSNGDPINFRTWSTFDAVESNAVTRLSAQFGSLSTPAAPTATAPPDPPDEVSIGQSYGEAGYYVGGSYAILKWDVDGGFVYAD